MNRVILSPVALPGVALAELKQWLGITTGHDDAALSTLLAAALDTCEAFIGQRPLETTYEEVLPAGPGWRTLATRPVLAIAALDAIAGDGTRTPLDAAAYEIELDADGSDRVRLLAPDGAARIAVRFTAGLAAEWEGLPDAIRHGLVRLAAHQHRQRENDGAAPLPPASVAALWRPWHRLRLA